MDNLASFHISRHSRLFASLAFGFVRGAVLFLVRRFVGLGPVVERQERVAVMARDGMAVGLDELRAALLAPESGTDVPVNVVSVAE